MPAPAAKSAIWEASTRASWALEPWRLYADKTPQALNTATPRHPATPKAVDRRTNGVLKAAACIGGVCRRLCAAACEENCHVHV